MSEGTSTYRRTHRFWALWGVVNVVLLVSNVTTWLVEDSALAAILAAVNLGLVAACVFATVLEWRRERRERRHRV